jgi:hypothetical protein
MQIPLHKYDTLIFFKQGEITRKECIKGECSEKGITFFHHGGKAINLNKILKEIALKIF